MAKKHSEIQAKYDKTHCKYYTLKMNLVNDADVINQLEKQESKQGYIKQLIRDDIARTRSVPVLSAPKNETEEKKMTVRELVQNWIENADVSPVPEIDIETAKQYISWMDPDTELPEELTPESFINAWNDIVNG